MTAFADRRPFKKKIRFARSPPKAENDLYGWSSELGMCRETNLEFFVNI